MGAAFCARALHLLAAPALSRIEIIITPEKTYDSFPCA
jgi:hypothetical protein